MAKRDFDIAMSFIGLILASPILAVAMLAIWLQDFHSPLYMAPRVGKGGSPFSMVKLRSMVVNADGSGVDSTSASDRRITRVGHVIRACKLDELSQLWNVLVGDMSLVGPRPQVQRDVALYTDVEMHLLDVRPGITDISSIVFADEGDILKGSADPDLDYNQRIRPWKSRLGLLYIEHASLLLDARLVILTALAVVSRSTALRSMQKLLSHLAADEMLKQVARREGELRPYPPPGASQIVAHR